MEMVTTHSNMIYISIVKTIFSEFKNSYDLILKGKKERSNNI